MVFFKRKTEVIDKTNCDGYYFRNVAKVELNREERADTVTFLERSCKMEYITFDPKIFTVKAKDVDGYHYLVLIFGEPKFSDKDLTIYYRAIIGDPLFFVRGLVAQESQGIVVKASSVGYNNLLHILESQRSASSNKVREAVLKDQVRFLTDFAEHIAQER